MLERHHPQGRHRCVACQEDLPAGPNVEHPKIKPAMAALSKLSKFMQRDASEPFCEAYEKEHSDEFKFGSRGFWERHLLLRP